MKIGMVLDIRMDFRVKKCKLKQQLPATDAYDAMNSGRSIEKS